MRLAFTCSLVAVLCGNAACAPAQTGIDRRIQVVPQATAPTLPATEPHKDHARLMVDAAATDWTDSGITVRAGETLTFTATGDIALAGHTLSPDGMTRGWRDMLRSFPVDTANAGALVGRIGDNAAVVPFTIGTAATLIAPEDGRLFLRVNSSAAMPASGVVTVQLRMAAASPVPQNHATGTPFAALRRNVLDTLPHRVADQDGAPGDAVNFALVGTEQQVRDGFARAGWVTVDTDPRSALLHGLLSTLSHKPYVEVPMSTLYLFGRPQDLSYARASAIAVAADRHHLRCWKTDTLVGGVPLWVGAATHDIGFERDQRNGNVTHKIAPEIDQEREFLRDSFSSSGAAAAIAYFTPQNPLHEGRTATGGTFTTDGRMLLVQLH